MWLTVWGELFFWGGGGFGSGSRSHLLLPFPVLSVNAACWRCLWPVVWITVWGELFFLGRWWFWFLTLVILNLRIPRVWRNPCLPLGLFLSFGSLRIWAPEWGYPGNSYVPVLLFIRNLMAWKAPKVLAILKQWILKQCYCCKEDYRSVERTSIQIDKRWNGCHCHEQKAKVLWVSNRKHQACVVLYSDIMPLRSILS